MKPVQKTYFGLLLLMWPAVATVGLLPEDYRPTDEVNLLDNPNGAWSYGWTQALGTEFLLHKETLLWYDKILLWHTNFSDDGHNPSFKYNPEDSEVPAGSVVMPPRQAALHPGQQNEQSVLRWTAPSSGECLVTATFVGLDQGGGTTTDVHVLHNGISIFDDSINGYLDEKSFSDTIVAASDDTVDFVVGFGNGSYGCDTTGIDVTISLDSNVLPPDTGMIYYSYGTDGYSMNPDGTGKTLLMTNLREWFDPSKYLHGEARWFLTALSLGGEGETYPDGRPRYEIYAVSTEGARVRLTNDPTLQPLDPEQAVGAADFHGLRSMGLRWALDDRKVSWAARRWGKDSWTGADVVVEVGIYAVELAAEVSESPLAAAPVRVPVEVAAIEIARYGVAPDVLGHDWSPDEQSVVLGSSTGLYVADLSKGERRTLAPSGAYPRWSPDGLTVAFDHDAECGGIDAIGMADAEAAPKTIVASDENILRCGAVWSPSGSHLAYVCRKVSGKPQPGSGGDDIRRSTAAGEESVLLTRDLPESAHPMGWRSDGRSVLFRRGDTDSNGVVNLTDAVFTLNYLFLSGPSPTCLDAADANDDGALNITDGIYVLSHLFLGGPAPPKPFPDCGGEEEKDGLHCVVYPICN